jgi:hypothetical protein
MGWMVRCDYPTHWDDVRATWENLRSRNTSIDSSIHSRLPSQLPGSVAYVKREPFPSLKPLQILLNMDIRGSNLKALQRDGGTGPHTVGFQSHKGLHGRPLSDQYEPPCPPCCQGLLFLGGGLPTCSGEEVIGVRGAPAAEEDKVCAQAGIDGMTTHLEPAKQG